MKLSDLKQSKEILLQILGIEKDGQVKCPFHDDRRASMNVKLRGGIWSWKCFAGCGSGTCIDAAIKVYNLKSASDAIKTIEKEMGVIIVKDEEIQEPIIDMVKAEEFINYAHNNLISNFALREYYSQKRKIFKMSTILKYRIGFIEKHIFPQWKKWDLTGWVMPITNMRGELVAVKIHQEKKFSSPSPKALWAPFGTYPEYDYKRNIKPINGLLTLWPPPELYTKKDVLIITPGELKALALIDSGYSATSPTTGENKLPERLFKRIESCGFKKIFINYDNDRAGKDYKDLLVKGFSNLGILAIPFAYKSNAVDILTKNYFPEVEEKIEVQNDENVDIDEINNEWVHKNLDERIQKTLEDGSIPNDVEMFVNQLSLEDKRAWLSKKR